MKRIFRSSLLMESPRDPNIFAPGPIDNGPRFMNFPKQMAEASLPLSSSEDDEPPTPPPKDNIDQTLKSPTDVDSYFNPFKASRANSIYSISRISFASQLSQLTSLNLPNASSLSTSISSIPTAPEAVATLSGAAEKIRRWLQKASEVLVGLDAEDDVEWAAAGGREGLGEVDTAIGNFEGLIGIYVTAIEDLQAREDISKVPPEELKAVVDRMEKILKEWENVRKLLKGVKGQVELAMEWEELWNVVLGDIGLEMENLSRLVFEMEETRHKALLAEPSLENGSTLDMQELETIVEEAPTVGRRSANHRFSLPPAFAATSPITSPGITNGHEDSSLLALFARMQPLRASLDFLPMTLSNFGARASAILPTACEELEARRKGLEKKWKKLESDAEGLRRELGEDRWVLVFRNAGRQAQKLCESVERSIGKLQESIDVGAHHSNPPILAKKIESYEAKKLHYGPAIERVLAIIEKGVNDRLTVNGEILRLHLDTRARWAKIESEMKDMDVALDYLNMNKNQLRDSVSSIVSMDRSVVSSAVDTPRSSPASSVVMGPSSGHKADNVTSDMNGASRRNSSISGTGTRPNHSRRYFSMPPGSAGTILPRQLPNPSSAKSDRSTSRTASPSPYSKNASSTPTPGSRAQRPTHLSDSKPRWNSSPRVDYIEFNLRPKPPTLSTPSPNRKSPMSFRSPHSASYSSSGVPLPSPLGRSDSSSPAPISISTQRSRHSGIQTSYRNYDGGQIASSPAQTTKASTDNSHPRPKPQLALLQTPSSSRDQNRLPETQYVDSTEDSSPPLPKTKRPTTALANGRRLSMLPVPKTSPSTTGYGSGREFSTPIATIVPNGRESVIGPRNSGRESVMGRDRKWR